MVGVFVGSFNPPTLAHLEIAKLLSKKYSKILFVPVNTKEKYLVSMSDRIEMLNILKRKYPFIIIDDIMNQYSQFNYRIIDLLQKKYLQIEIIIGSDLLNNLINFDNYEYLLSNYTFMVVSRKNNDQKVVRDKYNEFQNSFSYLEYHSSISSSEVREKIKNKKSVKTLIDMDVYQYIIDNHLYF